MGTNNSGTHDENDANQDEDKDKAEAEDQDKDEGKRRVHRSGRGVRRVQRVPQHARIR
ncbi:hypothetical protein [Paraburkholderia diazotrophica]|uniref:hypothetical protein n=1 Tax=Paraburkholderia diazotrophica TaxID=667676 RepID=UPI00317A327C